jgi:hypothetical protein
VKEIVIIPAWRLPEVRKAALTRLLVADDGRPEYWICLDRGHVGTLLPVVTWFRKRLGARARVGNRMHNYKGQQLQRTHVVP